MVERAARSAVSGPPKAVALFFLLVFGLAACGGNGSGSSSTPTSPSTPSVAQIRITPGQATLRFIGDLVNLSVVAVLSSGTEQNVTIAVGETTYQSSNSSVATVSTGGRVTAVASGQATISATYKGVTGSVPVTVDFLRTVPIAIFTRQPDDPFFLIGSSTIRATFQGQALRDGCQTVQLRPGNYEITGTLSATGLGLSTTSWVVQLANVFECEQAQDNGVQLGSLVSNSGPSPTIVNSSCELGYFPFRAGISLPQNFRMTFTVTANGTNVCPAAR